MSIGTSASEPTSLYDLVTAAAGSQATDDAALSSVAEPTSTPESPEPATPDPAQPTGVVSSPTEPEAAADDRLTPEDYSALVEHAQTVLGEKPAWLTKYTTLDDALRGLSEQQRLFGEGQNALGYIRQLQAAGVSDQDIMAAVRAKQTPPATPDQKDWDPNWVGGKDEKGAWLPSADAPADFIVRRDRYLKRWEEAAKDPSKLWGMMREYATAEINQAVGQVRQESQQQQQARIYQDQSDGWARQNAKHLYVNGEFGGTFTPMGSQINELLRPSDGSRSRIDASLSPAERMQFAFDVVAARARPAAAPAPAANPKAKHQASAAPGRKMTAAEWLEKYPAGDGGNLEDFAKAVAEGHVQV